MIKESRQEKEVDSPLKTTKMPSYIDGLRLLGREKGVGNMNGRSKIATTRQNPIPTRREMSAQGEWSRHRTKYSEHKIITRCVLLYYQTPFY
jgi:hypothetical protein